MPLSTKTKTTLITPDFASQIASNMKAPEEIPSEPVKAPEKAPVAPAAKPVTEKKSKYSDVANLHFSTGKRAEFKAFFTSNEMTLVQGVELTVNYIMKEVRAGKLTISRNGIEKVGEE